MSKTGSSSALTNVVVVADVVSAVAVAVAVSVAVAVVIVVVDKSTRGIKVSF